MATVEEKVTQNDEADFMDEEALKAEIMEKSMQTAPKGLKILVLALGLAIIFMLVLIVMKVVANATQEPQEWSGAGGEPRGDSVTSPASVTPATPVTSDGQYVGARASAIQQQLANISVQRPQGSVLVSASVSGNLLVLHFKGIDDSDQIRLVDLTTGKPLTTVQIAP